MLLGGAVCATLEVAAPVISDDEGFRMSLPSSACLLTPEGRPDPRCAGLDLRALVPLWNGSQRLATVGGRLFAAAALPARDGPVVFMLAMSAPPSAGTALSTEMLRVGVEGTLAGLRQTSGDAVRAQPFEPIEAAGTVGIRWFLTVRDEWPARGAFVRLFGARRTYTLAFFAPGSDARFRQRVAELVGRVELVPLDGGRRGEFNRRIRRERAGTRPREVSADP